MKESIPRLRSTATSALLAEIRRNCAPGESLAELIQRKPGIVGYGALNREERSLRHKAQWAVEQAEFHRRRVIAIQAELADITVIRESRAKRQTNR